MKRIYMSIIHLHSSFASYSSGDMFLYKEVSEQEFETLESKDKVKDDRFNIYEAYSEDNKYYNIHNLNYHASREEMLALAKKYEDKEYSFEKPAEYSKRSLEREETKDREVAEDRASKGYIFYNKPHWEYSQKEAQGGFSDDLWNYDKVKEYTSHFCFGYFGHSVRTKELDQYIEETLKDINRVPVKQLHWKELCYNYLSSSDARHFSDSLENLAFEEQKKKILENAMKMWNSTFIYSLPEHDGTWSSTKALKEKYDKFLLKE